jgi:hypothetical protein
MSPRAGRIAAWCVFAFTCVLWLVDLVYAYLTRDLQADTNWSNSNFAAGMALALSLLAFPVAGVLIATRRSGSRIGWLLLAIGLCWGVANLTPYADYGLRLHPGSVPAGNLIAPIVSAMWAPAIGLCGTFLLLLFPDGHLPSPRWRWVAWLSGFTIVAGTLSLILTPGLMKDAGYPATRNPYGIGPLATAIDAAHLVLILLPVSMVLSAAGLIARYRRAALVEREQIKWLAFAAALVAGTYAVVLPVSEIVSPNGVPPAWVQVAQAVALLSFALIPLAILVAVLRYRLFEIDVIIRRTITYAVLVALLGAGYVAGIWMLGTALRSLAGASGTIAVTVTTLLLWTAFQPLQARVVRVVDRRFARERYDAGRALAGLSARLRDRGELDAVERELLDVVAETLQPRHATLWLREQGP